MWIVILRKTEKKILRSFVSRGTYHLIRSWTHSNGHVTHAVRLHFVAVRICAEREGDLQRVVSHSPCGLGIIVGVVGVWPVGQGVCNE